MPQLPVSLASSQPPCARVGQQAPATAFSAEGVDGLEGLQGQNFGSILGKQMRGVANALLDRLENANADGSSEVGEGAEPSAGASTPVFFQVDFATLVAAPFPAAIQHGSVREGMAPAQTDAAKPMLDLSQAGETIVPAEIAGDGKNLPQRVSDEKLFADKLASLVEPPPAKTDSLPVTDLQSSAHAQESPVAMAVSVAVPTRQTEQRPAVPVTPAVDSAEWGGAFGEKVVWMATQNHQVAELRLNPPSLGPLEVRLTVSNDQATALFVSHHSAVREAIETALPRLREMLADNGIMLGNATVSSESFSQQQAFDQGNGKERSGVRGVDAIAVPLRGGGMALGLSRDGMVDTFA